MTKFLKNVLDDEEKVISRAKVHWIYIIMGLTWLICLTVAGFYIHSLLWKFFGSDVPMHHQEILLFVFGSRYPWIAWMFMASGLVIAILYFLKVIATEIALTDQRIIHKKGLIFVDVEEIDLAEIRAEHINHGLLGRFLGYGELHLDSRFVGDVNLPAVTKPYVLLKTVHKTRHDLYDPLDYLPHPHIKAPPKGR